MDEFRVGIIGCGRPWKSDGATGFGMSHCHALGYERSPYARIVALADLVPENAKAFQEQHGGDTIYTDYHEMLAKENLDIVSICTWPHLHAQMVIDAAEAGVRAIHCEKPMAPTWGEARRMVEACARNNVQLTFNHQRRFGPEFRQARELLRSGAIGDLVRLEGQCGNLFDWGTHWFDMFFFYNGETPATSVLAQVEPTGGNTVFGVTMEGQAISQIRFENGVIGLLSTSAEQGWPLLTRIVGTDGMIEAALRTAPLRIFTADSNGWQTIELEGDSTLQGTVAAGVMDLVESLKEGREPELSSNKVIKATELIFASYESARHGRRIDLPMDIADSTIYSEA
ncbi:MAG: Gfo/Idh/MocA family oxidoreductase [Thermomicrobiales bacterium]